MPNCPEYLATWLGLTRAGVIVALLNTNLSGGVLAHSINIVNPRYVIVGASLAAAARSSREHVPDAVRYWVHGPGNEDMSRLDLTGLSTDKLTDTQCPTPSLDDRALYIYTSGTTGLPKAANVSHLRVMQWSHWFAGLMDTQPTDRMYNCLPLYHSVGGVVATGATLVRGGTVVIRERFSASEFWKDIVAERCTLFQYIGELCRYLLGSPPHPDETRHSLRLCCGNGLRGDVWEPFQQRFHLPQILEYYASTEGSFSLYNCEGRPGAIGRIPPFLSHRMPVALVKFDEASGAPVRDANGLCVRCDVDEPGEALGAIANAPGKHGGRFEGYADTAASEKKILRNVFAPGDAWYRTGDLMRKDAQGFFYFVDRVGDTFRWKGENVSTSEVAAVLTAYPGIADAVVFGVAVPGADGRAGMAALVAGPGLDLVALRRYLAARLPDYARPVFLRLLSNIEITGTFKLRKQEPATEGYDCTRSTDALYFDDRQQQAYVRLDDALHGRLREGKVRV
jgi:fatty-acyl-CoA synthase